MLLAPAIESLVKCLHIVWVILLSLCLDVESTALNSNTFTNLGLSSLEEVPVVPHAPVDIKSDHSEEYDQGQHKDGRVEVVESKCYLHNNSNHKYDSH